MGYSIIEQEYSGISPDGEAINRVTIVADSESDVPDPKPDWAAGSMCMIADTHTYKVLNNEREWV